MATKKLTTISGMQPTGKLHVGNYLGALKNFVALQQEYQGFFMIADQHSLTETIAPTALREQILDLAAAYVAAGLDPKKCTIFLQSMVPEHVELGWIFSCVTPVGELERMTQYKDKAGRQKENINAGLFTYPTLMAADILLYHPQIVPVGNDQDQHIELARATVRRFNNRFGDTFAEPKALHTPAPRVMSLTDPSKKMSKSVPSSCLFLEDSPVAIKEKVSRAVTDTGPREAGVMSPGVANLFMLLEAFGHPKVVERFQAEHGAGTLRYSELKTQLSDDMIKALAPFQKKYATIRSQPKKLTAMLTAGSKKASKVAGETMKIVRARVGLLS